MLSHVFLSCGSKKDLILNAVCPMEFLFLNHRFDPLFPSKRVSALAADSDHFHGLKMARGCCFFLLDVCFLGGEHRSKYERLN